ncbi:MAG: GIY-YIG nuclease family protein [Kiritimatiellae bacterium]|jgi:putative endonuclease|nr:GIY-YIG nuclease family protein [Kiritimatiellia bacterium]
MNALPCCVYVLKSQKDGLFYIGFTTNLKRRLYEHNHGQSAATAPRCPFDLLYCEFHSSKSDALRREAYFKTSSGKKALRLMLRETLAAGPSTLKMTPRLGKQTEPNRQATQKA